MAATHLNRRRFLETSALGLAAAAWARPSGGADKPNIIIIMADDMGYSDIGCYGGEIHTPNLDKLAANGLRFTEFYNTGRCCPTRASLLTGLYAHEAGEGHMTADWGEKYPGYRGRLTERCVTIAEVLRPAGYYTAVAGKWHVGEDKRYWPLQRGFDRFYGVPQGGGFYYQVKPGRQVVLDNEVVYATDGTLAPEGWYTTDAFTDHAIEFVAEAVEKQQPFFLYLAHNAPHWPLQVDAADIAKYRGKYKIGWDAVREARYERMRAMGLLADGWKKTERDAKVPAWDTLSGEVKDEQDEIMATYAAVLERMDRNVGRLVDAVAAKGQLDNTLIFFLADNGGCAEGANMGNNTGEEPVGSPDSFVKYGVAWANVSNTPFRRYKHYVHEGGTSTPLIAHWPNVIREGGGLTREFGHVIDLMATCADVGGAAYPENFNGHAIVPLEGRSLRPIFEGKTRDPHPYFWEHEGNRAVRQGKWKLVAVAGQPWELHDMEADRTETNNLAAEFPERVRELTALYQDFTARADVIPWKERPKG